MPVPRARGTQAPAAAPTVPNAVPMQMQEATSPLVWVFVGITLVAAIAAISILAFRG